MSHKPAWLSCLLLIPFWGCADRYPPVTPRIEWRPARALVEQASVIVLARVTGVEQLGPTVVRASVKTRMWRVHTEVEYVVKGDSQPTKLVFYMYNFDERAFQNGSFERIWPPTRGFFFLCSEKGVLRAVSDLYQSHLDFYRPGLPRIGRFEKETPDRKIAALMLEGEDSQETPAEFAKYLPYGVGTSLEVAGFRFTEELVAPLLTHRDEGIRDAACIAVVNNMYGDDRCLTNVARNDPARAAEVQRRRNILLNVLARAQQSGQPSPLLDHAQGVDRSNPEEVRSFFEALSLNPNPLIASSARGQLQLLDKTR